MSLIQSKAAFLAAVLEPVRSADLVDFGYNRDIRNARIRQWSAAYHGLRRARLLLDYAWATDAYRAAKNGGPIRSNEMAFKVLVPRMRTAQALLLRTPAPSEDALTFKRTVAKQASHIPIEPDEVAHLISADAAFLAAHPISRRRAAKSSRS